MKKNNNLAVPATIPTTYYPAYTEYELKELLAGSTTSKPSLFSSSLCADLRTMYTPSTPLVINLPVLTNGELKEALRNLLLAKQEVYRKQFEATQAAIFDDLQKLSALGYEPEEGEEELITATPEDTEFDDDDDDDDDLMIFDKE